MRAPSRRRVTSGVRLKANEMRAMMSAMLKLQIGAGLDGPVEWLNVDASPTLRLQRLPWLGALFQHLFRPRFSPNIVYGDVVREANFECKNPG
jgi:hypothetical protein